jgi:hypothetical protein
MVSAPGPADYGFFAKRDGVEHYEPFQANNPTVATQIAFVPWQLTAWTVIKDPLAADFLVTHLSVKGVIGPLLPGVLSGGMMQIQVAEANPGGGGEINIMETALSSSSFITTTDGTNLLSGSFVLPMGPHLIASGRRLAYRIASSVPGAFALVSASVYAVGYSPAAPVGYPMYDYGRRMQGLYPNSYMRIWPVLGTQTIIHGIWPAYSAWISVIDPAPTDLLVWGVSDFGPITPIFTAGREYQFGTGPAGGGGEVVRAIVPCAEFSVLANGSGFLWRPLLVKRGERLSIRGASDVGYTFFLNVHYEEI